MTRLDVRLARHAGLAVTAALLVTLALLALAVAPVRSAKGSAPLAPQPPVAPHWFSGKVVTDKGKPLPDGTVVTVRSPTAAWTGTFTTTVDALSRYGYESQFYVYNVPGLRSGEPIAFYVLGVQARLFDVTARTWSDTYPYQAYHWTNLDLELAITHRITASAGPHGSISPSGAVTVDHGFDRTFTITPNDCYRILDVLVDGVSNPAAVASGSYTFANATADHTISATFSTACPPPLPHLFYGSATVDGQPAPVGAKVEARGAGVLTSEDNPLIVDNPLTVTVRGRYGGPGARDHQLMVQGEVEDNTPLEFYIDGARAECAVPGGPWQASYPYQAGMSSELNLRIGEGQVFWVYLPLTASPGSTLARFEARCQDDGTILVVWETSAEYNAVAYFLYRAESPDGPWDDYIDFEPAAGNEFIGATYSFLDNDVSQGVTYYYRLEEVAAHNCSAFFGPITARCPPLP